MTDLPTLQLMRLPHGAGIPCPRYMTDGAAGMDIHAAFSTPIYAGKTAVVSTGFAVAVPDGWELQIRSRSGLAANDSVHVLNSPATIDSDYRGELKVILHNSGDKAFYVERLDRIAQIIPKRADHLPLALVETLPPTDRGDRGLGSTGIK
jgi:dUTP pyrophosphatase